MHRQTGNGAEHRMSVGSTLVSALTVTVPVAGTLAGGYIVQRSEREKRREDRTAATQAAERAEAQARVETNARAIADVMTTGLAWRRTLSHAELARRRQANGDRGSIDVDEVTQAQAAFGTAVHTALALISDGEVYRALLLLENAYEDGFDRIRELSGDYRDALSWSDGMKDLSESVGRGMNDLQNATRQPPADPKVS